MTTTNQTEVIQDEREGLPSASAMWRIVNCPGSCALCSVCPKEKQEQVTQEGSDIHAAVETDAELGDESLDNIADKLRDLRAKAIAEWEEARSIRQGEKLTELREERVWVRNPHTLVPLGSAKVDEAVIHHSSGSALVIDFKTGFKETTPAENNWQLKMQALGIKHEVGVITHVRAGIAYGRFRPKLDLVDLTNDDLLNIEKELLFNLWRAAQPDAPRTPGEWCRYCDAKPYCREALAWASLQVTVATGPTNIILSRESALQAVAAMTPAALAKVQVNSTIIKAILESVNDRLKSLSEDQLREVGLCLKEGSTRRTITDHKKAYSILKDELGDDRILDTVKVDTTAAINALAAANKKTKSASREDLFRLLADVVETKQNSPSIAQIKPE